jgi:hypothetical protein
MPELRPVSWRTATGHMDNAADQRVRALCIWLKVAHSGLPQTADNKPRPLSLAPGAPCPIAMSLPLIWDMGHSAQRRACCLAARARGSRLEAARCSRARGASCSYWGYPLGERRVKRAVVWDLAARAAWASASGFVIYCWQLIILASGFLASSGFWLLASGFFLGPLA